MKTKVLLIEIGCDRDELNEPIALSCLTSYAHAQLGRGSFDATYLWHRASPVDWTAIDYAQYALVCISLQIRSYHEFLHILDALEKQSYPGTVVVGNVIPTLLSEELLRLHPSLVCVVGEGELAFTELVRGTLGTGSLDLSRLDSVPNLAFVKNAQVRYTKRSPTPLETFPILERPFASLIVARGGIARIEGSRGCHWGKCEFCSVAHRLGSGSWRPFPISTVVRELSQLSSAGVRSPYFSDEDFFGGQYERAEALAAAINEAKRRDEISPEMNFFISVLASDVKHPKGRSALLALRKAGLREVFVGIESLDDTSVLAMKKKANSDTNIEALRFLRENNIQTDIGSIMFSPDTTLSQLTRNYMYLEQTRIFETDSNLIKRLRVQPKTGFEHIYKSYISGSIDINEVEYPFQFSDNFVDIIWNEYRSRYADKASFLYELQASSRGEIASEADRLALKAELTRHRVQQFEYLGQLITDVTTSQMNVDTAEAADGRVQ